MAKQSGLGDNFYVGEFNISGDISSLGTLSTPMGTLESTGIDKSAMERLPGHHDAHLEGVSFFNDATGQAHDALSTLPTTDRVFSYFRGTTLGNPVFSMVAKQIGYDGNRADDGSFTLAFAADSNGQSGDWGRSLTAGVRTDTGATNGSSVDFGTGSISFGGQAYLHVFAFDGTDVTITVEDSTDDASFATLVTFSSVTGVTSERVATSTSTTQVDRYIRVTTTTTGGFNSVSFAVAFNRNDVASDLY